MNHCKILVTTDLAARGIDVHKVNLVINLGLPCPPDIYIHRMGRAGRYGSEGMFKLLFSSNSVNMLRFSFGTYAFGLIFSIS